MWFKRYYEALNQTRNNLIIRPSMYRLLSEYPDIDVRGTLIWLIST